MRLITTCVTCPDLPALESMIDNAEDITHGEFVDAIGLEPGYEFHNGMFDIDLTTLADDWHVTYHRSNYQGKPCVFMVHSAIEHVFQ